jgi:hypothetical protein
VWQFVAQLDILRGDDQAPPNAPRNHPAWGALAFRSETAVERMLERLESVGLLRARVLEHGGAVLDLTSAGQAALQNPAVLDERIQLPT